MRADGQRARDGATPPSGRAFCGVDVGASATKLVLIDETSRVLGRVVLPSGVDYLATARECLSRALEESGTAGERIAHTVSTGYGRHNVTFADMARTEIQCHGVGAYHHSRCALTVVDIGGQDNKVIHLDGDGQQVAFKMNRKCAAGTGAFIEEIALRLGVELGQMEALAQSTANAVRLSSFCTVFAKTEILAHLRRGAPVEGIIRGAFLSVVDRVLEMAPLADSVVLTGGVVAYNPTIVEILSERVGRKVDVSPFPQFTGAFGAALIAAGQYSFGGPPASGGGLPVSAPGAGTEDPDMEG